jgi:hypothetical protein
MLELFAAFFIALFVFFGAAALVGHVLLIAAMLQPRRDGEKQQLVPPRPKPETVNWRRAA